MATGFVERFKGKIRAAVIHLGAGGIVPDGGTANVTGALSVTGAIQYSVSAGLTAIGTNQATALQLTSYINQVSTAGTTGLGVVLPPFSIGAEVTVMNDGADPILVYGNGTDLIDGDASVTLTNAKRCNYFCIGANAWESAQLGVKSA